MFHILILLLLLIPTSAQAAQPLPTLQKLASGVYAYIGVAGNSNSGFIITQDGVVVVDSQMNPELAQGMLAEIRKVTDKPLLYLINTHFHGDHVFADHVFTGVKAIIAHEYTKQVLAERGDSLLNEFKKFVGEEASQGIRITLPTQTIKAEKTLLEVKGQTIELLYLGKGHTDGDIVVYLPKERIAFTGDLVYVERLPWLADADTREWLITLKKLKALNIDTMVPGHGRVGNKDSIVQFEHYLTDLRAEVFKSYLKGTPLDEAKKTIQLPPYQKYLKYREWLPFNIEYVYHEIKGS